MPKITVMIVDDHTLIRETWSFLLGRNENFEAEIAWRVGRRLSRDLEKFSVPDAPLCEPDVSRLYALHIAARDVEAFERAQSFLRSCRRIVRR